VLKSCRRRVLYSARVRFSIIGFSFLTVQACLQLLDDLFVHRAKGGLGRGRLGPAPDVLEDVEQDLDRSQIGTQPPALSMVASVEPTLPLPTTGRRPGSTIYSADGSQHPY
jgi:hypothetical protein